MSIRLSIAATACVFVAATAAKADEVQAKVCLIAAARQMPNIPGLVLKAWSETKTPADQIIRDLVAHASPRTLLTDMQSKGWIDGATSGKVLNADDSGEGDEARRLLADSLAKSVSKGGGAIAMELTATLMQTDVTFGATCVFDSLGSTRAEVVGIVR